MTLLADVQAPDLAALSPWAQQLAQTFVALAGDIALLVDSQGVIHRVALGASVLLAPLARDWVGRRWIDTVTVETRTKIERLLADVAQGGRARTRQVNHPAAGADVPVAYSAVRLGGSGPVLALGRELGEISQLQRRFVEIQQEMERGYWRTRQAASYHGLLIHAANDGVLRVDADGVVREANRSAGVLFGRPAALLAGVPLASLFEAASHAPIAAVLRAGAASGAEAPVRPLGSKAFARLASLPWPDPGERLLRLRVVDADPARRHRAYTRLVDRHAEAVFVADAHGLLLAANPALLQLTGAAAEAELVGRPVSDWLEIDGIAAFGDALGQRGILARGDARLRTLDGRVVGVDATAHAMNVAGEPFIGAVLSRLAPASAAERLALPELHAAVERLALSLGKRRLPELLDEARTIAEHYLIRAALERSGGDVEMAAELLGIRRADLVRRSRRISEPGAVRH